MTARTPLPLKTIAQQLRYLAYQARATEFPDDVADDAGPILDLARPYLPDDVQERLTPATGLDAVNYRDWNQSDNDPVSYGRVVEKLTNRAFIIRVRKSPLDLLAGNADHRAETLASLGEAFATLETTYRLITRDRLPGLLETETGIRIESEHERTAQTLEWLAELVDRYETTDANAATVLDYGDGIYSLNDGERLQVPPWVDDIFQVFKEAQRPLVTNKLIAEITGETDPRKRLNSPNISKYMTRLREFQNGVFAPAIRLPGNDKRGAGYFVSVKNA